MSCCILIPIFYLIYVFRSCPSCVLLTSVSEDGGRSSSIKVALAKEVYLNISDRVRQRTLAKEQDSFTAKVK